MTERVTLELSDETMRRAREAAKRTDRALETILSEWLDQTSAAIDISPIDPSVTYHIHTQFGAEGTAKSLLEFLKATEAKNKGAKGD